MAASVAARTLRGVDLGHARQAAGALLDRAPGAAKGNVQRFNARLAQIVGVVQDLIPNGDLWRLMPRHPEDVDQEGLGSVLDWSVAVLDEEALYRVLLLEANDEHRGLRVGVFRIPFSLTTVVAVTDIRTYDHGSHRLQRIWRFAAGATRFEIDEDRILGTPVGSDDAFTHELARRSGWPVSTDLMDS